MAINLSRNTKVYFTTNVNPNTGVISDVASGFTNTNTFEISVQDGYSFSQGTQQQTITIAEGGNTPVRGQRAFNTQLDPVDFSFSTYIRPAIVSSVVSAAEKVLWNALLGAGTLDETGTSVTALTRAVTTGAGASIATVTCAAITAVVNGVTAALAVGDVINLSGVTSNVAWNQVGMITTAHDGTKYVVELFKAPAATAGTTATGTAMKAYTGQWAKNTQGSYVSTMGSNKNQLQKFGMIFVVDSVVYAIDNCAMDQVSVDFGLEAISMGAWTGKGVTLKQLTTVTGSYLLSNSLLNNVNAPYITNKLSTLALESNIGGAQNTATASVVYSVPITGGNITISNNLSYLVPTNLGVVNNPIGYFTGQRSVSGNVTAYLRTGGSNDTGALLANLLASASVTTEPKFRMQLEMGGSINAIRVEFEMPGVVLQIPSVDVADVVSTTINFNAQGYTPDVNGTSTPSFDLTKANDLMVRYYSA